MKHKQRPKVEYYHENQSPPIVKAEASEQKTNSMITPIKEETKNENTKKVEVSKVGSHIKRHIEDNASSIKETSTIRKEAQAS